MSRFVLDSSAILAVINLEPGYEMVEPILSRSFTSSVNLAEVLTKLVERGIPLSSALDNCMKLGLTVRDFDVRQAEIVAELRPQTKHLGLSLGDRACLALAISENCPAVTADRNWKKTKVCKVETIR
jgi:ribonuclease VapC